MITQLPIVLTATLALGAASPCDDVPRARSFDFWIGEWNVNNRYLTEDRGWVDAGTATERVFPVLDGCAIVELWDGHLGPNHFRGFSVRYFDVQQDAWVLLLNWPPENRPNFFTLEGNFRHGRGEFFRERTDTAGNRTLIRYTFADIGPDSFRWNDGRSTDDGWSWTTRWIMEFSRRDPMNDLPLQNVTLYEPDAELHCTAAEAREFDFLLGEWTGVDSLSDVSAVRMQSIPILDGCAIMDLFEGATSGGEVEVFMVRSYVPSEEAWVSYVLDSRELRLGRFQGTRSGDSITLESSPGDAAAERVRRWVRLGPDRVRLELRPGDGGESATGAVSIVLQRVK